MTIPTVKDRIKILQRGADILAPVLVPHGFQFEVVSSGKGSGGVFAQGEFVRSDRRLESHFRYSLGLVTYHIAGLSLARDDDLRTLLDRSRGP